MNGAYTNARLTDDTPDVVGGRRGDQLPFTPKFSVALNGDYHWRSGCRARRLMSARRCGICRVRRRTTIRHSSGEFGRHRHIRAYGVIDLNAGVDFGRFDVEAYVKNLGNSHGVTSTTGTTIFGGFPIFPDGAIGTGIIRPRTIGLSLGFQILRGFARCVLLASVDCDRGGRRNSGVRPNRRRSFRRRRPKARSFRDSCRPRRRRRLARHDLTKADVDAWLDGFMPYALKAGGIPGAVVVVVKDGQPLTMRGFGYSDLKTAKAGRPRADACSVRARSRSSSPGPR